MKVLLDNSISHKISGELIKNNHDCVHVKNLNMASSPDISIFEKAYADNRIIISADTDFGFLLSKWEKINFL
jgi:predicted nuclease of predicted toxin-antitoxin system